MPLPDQPVFHDPAGVRARWLTSVSRIFLAIVGLAIGIFLLSIVWVPQLPHLSRLSGQGHLLPIPNRKHKSQSALLAQIRRDSLLRPKPQPTTNAVAGFYTPWQATSLPSLRANAHRLTHVMPQWLHVRPDGSFDEADADTESIPNNRDILRIARENQLKVYPILDNSKDGKFFPDQVHQLFQSPGAQKNLAKRLAEWLIDRKCDGINLDLEDLDSEDSKHLAQFVQILNNEFAPRGLKVTIDVQPEDDDVPVAALAKDVDFIVAMVYDKHSELTTAGPIAPINWSDALLNDFVEKAPPQKIVLGLGNYAYDWTPGAPADSLSYGEAMAQANGYREPEDSVPDIIDFDPDSLNSWFRYDDEKNRPHVVWMLDAASAYNQWLTGRNLGLRGAALWALGSEDPGIWQFLDRSRLDIQLKPSDLASVTLDQDVDTIGKGEVLQVAALAQPGHRKVEMDAKSGLIEDLEYNVLPQGYILRKSGYVPKSLVLTFDDGPDAQWTPQILSVLRKYGVPATFFVIGENAEANPNLVRQMVAEGHEIGSHTFTHPNLGAVTADRATMELNATQRAIEAITGRSTILFRPPYNADSTPSTGEELRPVLAADRLGYITVGESVDPTDWDLHGESTANKTKQIVSDTLRQVAAGAGNVILLHDGGGNRMATVAALDQLIPALRAEGYTFTTVAHILGKTKAEIMAPLSPRDQLLVNLDGVVFSVLWGTGAFLSCAFLFAIFLGFLRAGLILPLAAVHRRRQVTAAYTGTISVIIAAFNESKVIQRTISSVLSSDYPNLEVVVVDDGSTDGTADKVREAFATDPRVKLILKPNGGKASALNLAIEQSSGDVLVGVDADTQLAPDTITKLVSRFGDERIGAVAGNVRVGNAQNLLTIWQSIEYTTAQNLDRRAYAVLNAVTVVPGAIGAWRKSVVATAGGYQTDTLAEDMDLTWRIREAGYRIETENSALAFTEAPETLTAFFKQRFRWAYGTLQCLWKHRRSLGRYGWFGCFALPSLWLFQVIFMALAPLVDLQVVWSLLNFWWAWQAAGTATELSPLPQATQNLTVVLTLYGLFFLVELITGLVAYRWERRAPWSLAWLFIQRFVYRQVMYGVVYKSIFTAIRGSRTGWNKLERRASVKM